MHPKSSQNLEKKLRVFKNDLCNICLGTDEKKCYVRLTTAALNSNLQSHNPSYFHAMQPCSKHPLLVCALATFGEKWPWHSIWQPAPLDINCGRADQKKKKKKIEVRAGAIVEINTDPILRQILSSFLCSSTGTTFGISLCCASNTFLIPEPKHLNHFWHLA